jgi:hypothetical protein
LTGWTESNWRCQVQKPKLSRGRWGRRPENKFAAGLLGVSVRRDGMGRIGEDLDAENLDGDDVGRAVDA